MTRENAKKLQSTMAKEAVTLLMLGGAEADTAEHEEAIRLIGEAWGLAEEETARQIERIGHGRQSVRMGAENTPPDDILSLLNEARNELNGFNDDED